MIRLFSANSFPMAGTGIACNEQANSINTRQNDLENLDFCPCDYQPAYYEYAFVYQTDVLDWYKNDYKDLLIDNQDTENGAVDFYLVTPSGQEILIDDTIGDFYDFGDLSDTKKGAVIKWHLVADLYGFGFFKIKTILTSFGNTSEYISHDYYVVPFTERLADRTVKIETTHNGYIGNKFDYQGINWRRYIRVEGMVSSMNAKPVNIRYVNSRRNSTQIQTKVEYDYKLTLESVNSDIFTPLFNDRLLANTVLLTDYSLMNPLRDIKRLEVYWNETESIIERVMNRDLKIELRMNLVDENTLKRQL